MEMVLDSLGEALDQFEVAVKHGSAERQAHVGASRDDSPRLRL
jgi:hypothetical protein